MTLLRKTLVAGAVALASLASLSVGAQAEKVRVSYQPLYWTLPFYVAAEKGYWKEMGLEPEFSVFPAGPQQIAAAQSWDLGGTGGPPAVLGAVRMGLLTAAIMTDESAVTGTVARAAEAEAILKNPASLKGKQLLVTTNSTGEYSALACLKKFGLSRNDVQIVNLAPSQLISAYSNGNGAIAASWAPFVYVLQEKSGAKEICNGRIANAFVTSNFIVKADYAKEKPDVVLKSLAVYLRAVSWLKKNPEETLVYLKKFNEQNGVSLSKEFLIVDRDRRTTYTLAEQLAVFDRTKGPSTFDKWSNGLAEYLVGTGTLKALPDPKSYLVDEFLKKIEQDPKLRAFANGE